MNRHFLLVLAALICFTIKASNVGFEKDETGWHLAFGPIDWVAAGFAFLTATLIFG